MQPKSVLYEYLADLLGEPAGGSFEGAAGDIRTVASATAFADCAHASRSEQPTAVTLPVDIGLCAGEYSAGRLEKAPRWPVDAVASGIPGWAVDPFQVLFIRAHGVDLALPLHQLDTIVRWNGAATSIPGQPRWQIGLMLHKQRKVSLVDLSTLIMPERQVAETPPGGYLLLVGGARWGLACDSIQRPRLLRAGDVRWRRNREIRPWSHGVIVEDLTVLLNIEALLMVLGTNDA